MHSDLAPGQPEFAARFELIFKTARVDSERYVNPGESKEQIEARRERTRKARQMIVSRRPNGLPQAIR